MYILCSVVKHFHFTTLVKTASNFSFICYYNKQAVHWCLATMATQASEPRYTIEQIELLRRLIRTGLTKQEIIHALDTMTKLDSELSQGREKSLLC